MKITKINATLYHYEVEFNEKNFFNKIGLMIMNKKAKFSHYAFDKLYYISYVPFET